MSLLCAGDWPQYLGAGRDGAAQDEKALSGAAESVTLWKKSLGSGYAGPVVAAGVVIVCHRMGGEMLTEALDAKTGQSKWVHRRGTNYRDSFGFDDGPRAVPCVADGLVFTHGADGIVQALDLADGREVWSYDTVAELQSPQGFFGRACSPLVADGKVLLNVGGRGGAGIIALEAKSGKIAWKATDHEAGYASPILMPGDAGVAAFFTRNGISLLEVASGKVLADEPLRADIDASVNAATPVPCGPGRLLFSASYDVGCGVWQWDAQTRKLENAWRAHDVLDCHYSTPVAHAGYVFGFHGRQESGAVLRCISATDGKVQWESSDRVPGGTLIRVGDKLLIVTEKGELWIVKADGKKYERVRADQILRSGHRSHAAYSAGVLYARDAEKMVAVKVE
ncbi:MAG: PQQ-binding-like beta-propeller repeat protein [Verrucomicrobiaceae bacterium]|nr:PQQ-binding-like beta-propeller repeat protein [Verrucomicrobiaceae bacterium]